MLLGQLHRKNYLLLLVSKTDFNARCHMFYGQRCIDIPDGLPKWTGLNKDSDLIEDSPPEQIKELARQREKERAERFEKGENQ